MLTDRSIFPDGQCSDAIRGDQRGSLRAPAACQNALCAFLLERFCHLASFALHEHAHLSFRSGLLVSQLEIAIWFPGLEEFSEAYLGDAQRLPFPANLKPVDVTSRDQGLGEAFADLPNEDSAVSGAGGNVPLV